jgi:hypothetical protein
MNIFFLQPALDDLTELTDYFDLISARLGLRFRQAVEKTLDWILDFPKASAVIRKNYRVRQIIRFRKYGIVYRINHGSIFIHGIFQLQRGPRFWRSRM